MTTKTVTKKTAIKKAKFTRKFVKFDDSKWVNGEDCPVEAYFKKKFEACDLDLSFDGDSGTTELSLNDNRNRVHVALMDGAEFFIAPDKKRQQLVLVMREPGRIFADYVSIDVGPKYKKMSPKEFAAKFKDRINNKRVSSPGSKWIIQDQSDITLPVDVRGNRVQVRIVVTAPKHVTCFLIGYDEMKMFISQLPKVVYTVSEAHKVLRPKGVTSKTPRMGEFFFVPSKEHKKFMEDMSAFSEGAIEYGYKDMLGSFIVVGGKTYAIGTITHEDKSRHKGLFLETLHEVVRNTEIENTSENWD